MLQPLLPMYLWSDFSIEKKINKKRIRRKDEYKQINVFWSKKKKKVKKERKKN